MKNEEYHSLVDRLSGLPGTKKILVNKNYAFKTSN